MKLVGVFPGVLSFLLLALVSCNETASSKQATILGGAGSYISDFHFEPLSDKQITYYKNRVTATVPSILGNNFSGAILVAKNGVVVYEDYKGYANPRTKEPVTSNTPFHLASVSKTITGTTVLKLWEQGRLSLEDTVQQYFPAFPYHGITVRMLLSHRSGLPNYLYFLDKGWNRKVKATNEDVLNFMITNQPPRDNVPGRGFHYCNTNYILLALIVEKITGMQFPQYMKDSVFTPLGMNHSFVFSIKDTSQYVPTYVGNVPYAMDHLDCTYGDKNIYSTVQDMLLWDKAMYEHSFVRATTLDTAFTPTSHERKSMHNYGLGWRLFINGTDSIVYHNGKWHGSNTAFTRLVQDTATIIVLGNRYNRAIYQSKKLGVIFSGKQDNNNLEE